MTRESRWGDLRVGLIAIAAIVVLAILIIKLDRNRGLFAKATLIRAELTDLKGLRIGAPVQFSGVEVGSVKQINFQADGSVVMTMGIKNKVRPLIKQSSTISIEPLGILGDKYVLIHAGKAEDPVLGENEIIKTRTSSDVLSIVSDTSQVVGRIRDAVEGFNRLVDEVNQGKGTLSMLLNDEGLYAAANGLFSDLNKALKNNSSLGKLAKDPKLYNDLQRAAKNLAALLQAAKNQESTLGRLMQEDTLYKKVDALTDQLSVLSTELTDLVKDIKKRPKRYFDVSVF